MLPNHDLVNSDTYSTFKEANSKFFHHITVGISPKYNC